MDASHFAAAEREEIRAGCYEMLLVLAEAEAPARPDQPPDQVRGQAEEALRLLDRADKLGIDTRASHQRRARYLVQLGERRGGRERERAAALREFATDFYLLGDDKARANDLSGHPRLRGCPLSAARPLLGAVRPGYVLPAAPAVGRGPGSRPLPVRRPDSPGLPLRALATASLGS